MVQMHLLKGSSNTRLFEYENHLMEHTMKIINLALISSFALISMSASAGNFKYVAANNNINSQICEAAGNDNLMKYDKKVSDSGSSQKHTSTSIVCNGVSLAKFTNDNNAVRVAKRISRYTKGQVTLTDYASIEQPSQQSTVIVSVN